MIWHLPTAATFLLTYTIFASGLLVGRVVWMALTRAERRAR